VGEGRLRGQEGLDQLLNPLDNEGWWSVFEPLRARQFLYPRAASPTPQRILSRRLGSRLVDAEALVDAEQAVAPPVGD
jgi:hypothetical protein